MSREFILVHKTVIFLWQFSGHVVQVAGCLQHLCAALPEFVVASGPNLSLDKAFVAEGALNSVNKAAKQFESYHIL